MINILLQALVRYYEILSEDVDSGIPTIGYNKIKVSYALNISIQGELLNIVPLKIKDSNGKKEIPQIMELPCKLRKASEISSNFLCDNSSYVLGFQEGKMDEKTKKCFNNFKELCNEILSSIECDEATALLCYVNKWDAEKSINNEIIKEYLDKLKKDNIIFQLDGGGYIHQNNIIKKAWEKYYNSHSSEGRTKVCLVSGEKSNIALIHPKISGIGGTNPGLVTFDKASNAYCSYGKDGEQGYNAPVSSYCCSAYGLALNYLLSSESNHIYLGSKKSKIKENGEILYEYSEETRSETTVVFWSEAKYKRLEIEKTWEMLLRGDIDNENDEHLEFSKVMIEVFKKMKLGKEINFGAIPEWKSNFYILGLSPSKGRVAVKFLFNGSFKFFLLKISQHYEDMHIEKQKETDKTSIPLRILLSQTVSIKSKESPSPLLESAILRSILTGLPYPRALYNAVMIRIHAEHDINYYKAAIIKAYLIRSHNKNDKYKEVLTMALNEQSDNKFYVLGRLFAVLEKAQVDANPKITTTIKDRYFTSACATPANVFPLLLRLSNYHIAKAEYGFISDNRIKEILNILNINNNPFPKNLSLEEQGFFILGYYHQKNTLYKKNNKE